MRVESQMSHESQLSRIGDPVILGTIGVLRIFIPNFAHCVHKLVKLTWKGTLFKFSKSQVTAQEDLKDALIYSPALWAINYTSNSPVILAVDTSHIAVRFFLCKCDPTNPKVHHYNWFGSITLNDREVQLSQPKLEIYSLFRALQSLWLYLLGVCNLVIKVDARYIKGMLSNPDIQPSASINRWILSILTFHFTLVHIKGTLHGPDRLSRCPPQPGDLEEEEMTSRIGLIAYMDSYMWYTIYFPLPRLTVSPPHPPFIATLANIQVSSEEDSEDYNKVPHTKKAQYKDQKLAAVQIWHRDLVFPEGFSNWTYKKFLWYATQFFVDSNCMWKKNTHGSHQLVIGPMDHLQILSQVHDNLGHWGFYATWAVILQWFWWPHIQPDLPHLPSTTDNSSLNPSYSCNSSSSIFQNLYWHHAYAWIARFQIYCPRVTVQYAPGQNFEC